MDTKVTDLAKVARQMWIRYETYHAVTYFTPESRAATDALGCKGGWMGYFAMRAAPMGAVPPEVIISAFYNFHPSLVRRAIPEAWHLAEPKAFLAARLTGADGALRRLLGQDTIDSPELAEAAELAARAADAAPTAGRPLAVANSLVPKPEAPHLALWQASTTLRESRGDGHVAALVTTDLDPCETLVLFAADRGMDPGYLQTARKWSVEAWQAATERLTGRGLLSASAELTAAGGEQRREIEDQTDRVAVAPWRALGQTGTARLAELLRPLAQRIAAGNEAMRVNPMGLDAVRELA
jgi:hypothetical protein